jgi:hypothetical protein
MKSITLVLLFLVGTMSFAQPQKRGHEQHPKMDEMKEMSAEKIATLMSKKMTLLLDLSETQQTKVYDLILESTVRKKALRANRAKGKPTFEMQNKMLDDKITFSRSMKTILDDKQYSLWKQQNHKKKRKPKHP